MILSDSEKNIVLAISETSPYSYKECENVFNKCSSFSESTRIIEYSLKHAISLRSALGKHLINKTMKKYRVTEKHPEIIEGVIFKRQNGDGMYLSESNFIHIPDEDISILLHKGWIEEVQEPEFTKDDMINFLKYYTVNNNHFPVKTTDICKEWFSKFIKFKKESGI